MWYKFHILTNEENYLLEIRGHVKLRSVGLRQKGAYPGPGLYQSKHYTHNRSISRPECDLYHLVMGPAGESAILKSKVSPETNSSKSLSVFFSTLAAAATRFLVGARDGALNAAFFMTSSTSGFLEPVGRPLTTTRPVGGFIGPPSEVRLEVALDMVGASVLLTGRTERRLEAIMFSKFQTNFTKLYQVFKIWQKFKFLPDFYLNAGKSVQTSHKETYNHIFKIY